MCRLHFLEPRFAWWAMTDAGIDTIKPITMAACGPISVEVATIARMEDPMPTVVPQERVAT